MSPKSPRLSLRVLAVALVALALAAVITVTPNAASAGAAGVLVTGRLTTESGTPAANVTVNGLLRMPNHKRSSQAAEINVPVLASTITDGNGAFTLAASPALVAPPFVDEGGAINLTLHMISDSGELLGVSEVSLYRPTGGSKPWQANPAGRATGGSGDVGVSLELQMTADGVTTVSEQKIDAAEMAIGMVPANITSDDSAMVENAPLGCGESDQGRVGTYNTILQTLGTNSSSVQYDYEFNSSGSTSDSITVGIGYSKGGSSGSFSQSGTTKLSSSITINYPARTTVGRRHYYTKTNYNKYFLACSDFNGGYYTYYEIRPTSVTGDAWEGTLTSASYTYCTILGAGITASRSTGRTVNYSNGIDVTVMGSDLKLTNELESGESHKVTFKNTSTTSKKICGQYTTIGDSTKGTGILVGAA